MKINANSIRVGNVIEYQNNLWQVLKRNHVKPGKGGAYVQVEMKDIINGTKNNVRFISTETIEKAHLENKKFQYQYMDGNDLVAMDMESFESFNFSKELLHEQLPFLQDEMEITVEYCNDNAINITLSDQITMAISETESVVKGQTATSSFKPAILENGVKIMVPQFITSEDKIVIRMEDLTYVAKSKS
ncbi:elongation factor P [Rickettsiales bacterium]|nr:elongation factor P [Rickettsiales bacterium]